MKQQNPFKKLELSKKLHNEATKAFNIKPNFKQIEKNYIKFLKNIKKKKQILVVAHGGTLQNLEKILCGIDVENTNMTKVPPNCSIMCIQYNSQKKRFKFVSSANSSHLT